MEELDFYQLINGEWICHKDHESWIFKYDGFHMFRRENTDWIQSYEWSLVRPAENDTSVSGIALSFLGLPELLLGSFREKEFITLYDMNPAKHIYYFTVFQQ